MLAYVGVGIVVPFAVTSQPSGRTAKECSSGSALLVYGAYGGLFTLSTICEGLIQRSLRTALRIEGSPPQPVCNSYLLVKWLQGQLSNLDTFVHTCFLASALSCARSDIHDQDDRSLERFVVYVLTAAAAVALVAGNARRAAYVYTYLRAQPAVHRLLPNAFRNTQLAWVCNF